MSRFGPSGSSKKKNIALEQISDVITKIDNEIFFDRGFILQVYRRCRWFGAIVLFHYQASRKEIHAKGLLHREIHIWLYTPQGEIIFQHRSKTKDLYPDTLGTSVGGHVDVGESYEHAALREMNEELGIKLLSIDELYFLMTLSTSYVDPISKMTNNSRRNVYAFPYLGDIADLKIEPGESQGFVLKPVQYMFSLTDAEKAKIQMNLASPEYRPVFETILGLVS